MRKASLIVSMAWGCLMGPALGAAAPAGGGMGAEPQGSSVLTEELVTIPVTVEELNRRDRTLTVRTLDGDRMSLSVPSELQGFDKLKIGDKVDMDYYRAVATRIVPSGATVPTSAPLAQGGRGPQLNVSSQVIAVNEHDGTFKVKQPDGRTQTVSVQDPTLRAALRILRPGDLVDVTYTQAVLAGVHPRSK